MKREQEKRKAELEKLSRDANRKQIEQDLK